MPIKSRLFDVDATDLPIDVDASVVEGLSDRQLLWTDVEGEDDGELRGVAQLFSLERESIRNLLNPIGRPRLDVMGRYFEVNVVALVDAGRRAVSLDLFAGPNWVVTAHRQPITFLEDFRARVEGDTDLGQIEASSFLAALLDWQIGTYFDSVDELEHQVDLLDDQALRYRDNRDLLKDLVRLRRRIAIVRRTLSPHREVFAALARPDFEVLAASRSGAHFRSLHDRLERAIAAVENARELLIGSFDVYMTQTAQRTNDVMRVLTIVNVILLPSAVLAGVMGMNFKLGFFDEPSFFWVVIGVMVAIGLVTLVVARWRRWL